LLGIASSTPNIEGAHGRRKPSPDGGVHSSAIEVDRPDDAVVQEMGSANGSTTDDIFLFTLFRSR
jgi:hypothetical protein